MSQALHLANGSTINDKLRDAKSAVSKAIASKRTDDEIIDQLFLAALARKPTEAELDRLRPILAAAGDAETRQQAIEDLYWATLTGNEFLFNH